MKSKPRKKTTPVKSTKRGKRSALRTTSIDLTSVPLPTGALTVTVTQFRSLGAITPLQAKIGGWTGFEMPGKMPMPQPEPTLTLTDDNVTITSQYPIRLIFNMPDPRYVFSGVAWEAVVVNHVGENTFPDVLLLRTGCMPEPYGHLVPAGSCLIITDNAQEPGNYNYVLLIQDVETGEIGMLDPGMDNHPQN